MTAIRPANPDLNVALLQPRGDLDAMSSSGFRRDLEQAASTGARLLLVDMQSVDFLDSAGLSALVGLHRNLPQDQVLAIANVPARLQRALEIAAIGRLFTVHCYGDPWPWPDISCPIEALTD